MEQREPFRTIGLFVTFQGGIDEELNPFDGLRRDFRELDEFPGERGGQTDDEILTRHRGVAEQLLHHPKRLTRTDCQERLSFTVSGFVAVGFGFCKSARSSRLLKTPGLSSGWARR